MGEKDREPFQLTWATLRLAIHVPPCCTVQKRDTMLPGERPGSSPGERWTSKEARGAPGPERASPLRRGSPGLDSGSLGWPLFPPPAWPG